MTRTGPSSWPPRAVTWPWWTTWHSRCAERRPRVRAPRSAGPYNLTAADARVLHNQALFDAANNGHVAVVDRLSLPPYGLGATDAERFWRWATDFKSVWQCAPVLRRLALSPFNFAPSPATSAAQFA